MANYQENLITIKGKDTISRVCQLHNLVFCCQEKEKLPSVDSSPL